MKALGLTGAGLGAAAATMPVIHDLDELASGPQTSNYDVDNINQRPWYVKNLEHMQPNPETDWSLTQKHDGAYGQRAQYPEESAIGVLKLENTYWKTRREGLAANTPGYQLKDFAVDRAMRFNRGGNRLNKTLLPWDGSDIEGNSFHTQGGPQYREIGRKEWQGTPEENLKMWRAAMHLFGSRTVGALEIDSRLQKMFKTTDTWENIPEGYQENGNHYPSTCNTYASYSVEEKDEYLLYGAGPLGLSATMGYYNGGVLQYRSQRFLTLLGYQSYYTTSSSNPGIATLNGVAELGRNNLMITPDFGSGLRLCAGQVTDLPMAPTKPIDYGVWKFCETCLKCADACEEYNAGSGPFPISREDPSYDVNGPWNRVGTKKYQTSWMWCHHCGGFCRPSCVFGTQDQSSIHQVVKGAISTTSIFNSFFRQMDDMFGFETVRSDEACAEWWNRDLKKWPHDTILG
jgi:reductive dehalogenase